MSTHGSPPTKNWTSTTASSCVDPVLRENSGGAARAIAAATLMHCDSGSCSSTLGSSTTSVAVGVTRARLRAVLLLSASVPPALGASASASASGVCLIPPRGPRSSLAITSGRVGQLCLEASRGITHRETGRNPSEPPRSMWPEDNPPENADTDVVAAR
jgi:hypothetical protein